MQNKKIGSKKALFIQIGSFSHVNTLLLGHLQKNFNYLDFEIIDVWPKYVQYDLINILYCFLEFGSGILRGRYSLSGSRLKTTYIFNKIRSKLERYIAKNEYLFTIQTQSLFDASSKRIPHFVYTDHTHLANLNYPGFSKEKLSPQKWIELERSIYDNADMVFTYSESIRNSVINQYHIQSQKVKCVYAGCNIPVPPPEDINTQKYFNKNILFVGLDWERKGGPLLVQAFQIVLEKHPDATLTIVGASPEVQLRNCHVIGPVSLGEVQKYYEKASVFCMPTLLEPLGIVFLEAMSHRLPVIATNIGAIPEFVNDGITGFLVPPNDVNSIAERICILLDDPAKCQSIGENGYELVLERYTWENTSKLISESIYSIISFDKNQ